MRSAIRGAGRVALWALVALLLARGFFATVSGQGAPEPSTVRAGTGEAEEAFAVRFARSYLADPGDPALAGFLAENTALGGGRPPRIEAAVAQAEVSATEGLGDGKAVLTVACELRDARTLYLAVPIARSRAGGVAVLGAPSLVAGPAVAGVESDRPQPLAGEGAGEIALLARHFLTGYLSAESPGELAYLVAPGTAIQPLGGAFRFLSFLGVEQLGFGEGPRRELVARIRAEDTQSGAIYPLAYRLGVRKDTRWYVTALAGVAS
ncbi:MAG: conjugal transfer protein [Solirubrobacterales bacterium]